MSAPGAVDTHKRLRHAPSSRPRPVAPPWPPAQLRAAAAVREALASGSRDATGGCSGGGGAPAYRGPGRRRGPLHFVGCLLRAPAQRRAKRRRSQPRVQRSPLATLARNVTSTSTTLSVWRPYQRRRHREAPARVWLPVAAWAGPSSSRASTTPRSLAVLVITHAAVTWSHAGGGPSKRRETGALYDHVHLAVHWRVVWLL